MNRINEEDVLRIGPRTVVREIKRLVAERAEREESLTTWHEQAQRDLARDGEKRTEEIKSAADEEVATLEQKRTRRLEKTKTSHEEKEAELRKAHDLERESLVERAEDNEQKASHRLEEAVWIAESMYEAKQDQPREDYEQQCRIVDLTEEEAESIREEAMTLLRSTRMQTASEGERDTHATPPDESSPLEALEASMETARDALQALRSMKLIRLSRGVMPIIVLVVFIMIGFGAAVGAGLAIAELSIELLTLIGIGGGFVAGLLFLAASYLIARSQAHVLWQRIHTTLNRTGALREKAKSEADEVRERKERELKVARDREVERAKSKFGGILESLQQRREERLQRLDAKFQDALEQINASRRKSLREIDDHYRERIETATSERDTQLKAIEEECAQREKEMEERRAREWEQLKTDWIDGMTQTHALREAVQEAEAMYFHDWDDARWENWSPPHQFAPAVRFGRLDVDINAWPGGMPTHEELTIDGPTQFTLPATLGFPDECSLLIERDGDAAHKDIRVLQAVMLRLLTCVPPGKLRFTIIDPIGLGQNFAGFMHLADYNEQFVSGKIWTESRHIEQRLSDLTEHMENVIQKYLRNEFETIDEYNEQAGEIAEPYRYLVIADFPANFSEAAMKRLASIISSGPRCGVHTLIARNVREKLPAGLDLDDLKRESANIVIRQDDSIWDEEDISDVPFTPEPAPDESFLTRIVNIVGKGALESSRVEVPFEVIAPDDAEAWSLKTDDLLRVPLGRSGATKRQELRLGEGTSQHALIAGKTGSGKSTLLHALITNLTLWYSPDEIELYLVDFKKGVEFKTYAKRNLPHIRAVAIESDREFGISVLERLDQEMLRRGERFRELGVQDLAAFRKAAPDERMPRVMLIIDEFQEFFVEDDKIAQEAGMLLDRLVRQGRAFGMHVLLGSQTLGGAYTLARSTMGQMGVRIALQCNESDSYLILSEDNAAARLLSRPGEAIYNDANGMIEGNSPFQVVWLPEPVREKQLKRVENLAGEQRHRAVPPPIVFEGNQPAKLSENHLLAAALDGTDRNGGHRNCAWLGESIAIKDPANVVFQHQSAHNMLIVGQRNDAALGVMSASLISLAVCRPDASFYVLDGSTAETDDGEILQALADAVPHNVRIGRMRDLETMLGELTRELEQRQAADDSQKPPVFLFVFGLHRFRDLRHDDSYSFSMDEDDKPPSPDKLFSTLVREGPPLGMHTVCWCDSVGNLNRTFERQTLREFEFRVLFQMSQSDSSMLIDTPEASKLGFHRALLACEEEGRMEKFRPYAPPEQTWLADLTGRMTAVSR